MENLMNLETESFDLDNMTDEQLEVQANKILFVRQKRAEKKIEELANKQAKLEEEAKINGEKLEETATELEKTKKFINVLGFAVNSYKFQILKSKATARVYELLNNDISSIDFIVWSPYFFQMILKKPVILQNIGRQLNITSKKKLRK